MEQAQQTEALLALAGNCPELNLSNYGDDDVSELNSWAVEVAQAIEATVPALNARIAELERYQVAYAEWIEKTEWVRETAKPKELGMHRADILRARIAELEGKLATPAPPCLYQIAEPLSEQDAGLLEQAASMLEALEGDERNRGNCSAAEAAGCSAHAVRRLAVQLLQAAPPAQTDSEMVESMMGALHERDEAEEFVDKVLDLVLGLDRHEWSSAYDRADALADVEEKMATPPAPAAVATPDERLLVAASRAYCLLSSGLDLSDAEYGVVTELAAAVGATHDAALAAAPAQAVRVTLDFEAWWEKAGDGKSKMMAKRAWEAKVHAQFQQRVQPWLLACFGAEIAADHVERNHRFLEEALELVQSCGCTASEAHQLVDYVFGRPVGEPAQEVGGVMVTLAALCLANDQDMHSAGETELARIWGKVEQIRAKQAAKPKHSPLPAAPAQAQGGQ